MSWGRDVLGLLFSGLDHDGRSGSVAVEYLHSALHPLHLLEDGDGVGASLSSAVLGPRQDVSAAERDRNGGLLDRRRLLPTLLEDAHQEFA